MMAMALVFVVCTSALAQSDDLAGLNKRIEELYRAGKYSEAIPLAEKSLQLTRALKGELHLETASRTSWLAFLYQGQGRLAEAEPLYKRSLETLEKALPAGHPYIANSLNNLAYLYRNQGRLAEAEPLYKRALEIHEKALPASHPDIVISLNNLAELYRAQGRFAEAEPMFKRSLEKREKALPAGHPDIARSLNDLADLYVMQGSYGEAEILFKRALEMREKTLPSGHPDIATSLNNLGILYRAQGRLTEAERMYKRALEMREKVLPTGHPSIAMSLNNLALLYQVQGRFADAEPLLKRALELGEKALPSGHPNIATGLNNLAELYRAEGRLAEAEPLHKRALEMREKALPVGHPDIAASLNNLALLYQAQGRFTEAELLSKRALEIYERALPSGHPDIALSLNNLAMLYKTGGRLGEAEPLYKRTLDMYEKALPSGHPGIATSLNNLALLYQDQGRFREAESLLKRALEMREKALPSGHPDIAHSLNNLASIYDSQGHFREAEPLLKRALEIFENALPVDHPDIALSLNNLAELYRAQGRLAEAEPLYKRALETYGKALPAGHPSIILTLGNLAHLQFLSRRHAESLTSIRRATAMLIKRGTEEASARGADNRGEIKRNNWYFQHHVRSAWRVNEENSSQGVALRAESFRIAQWAIETETASALAQMAARFGSGTTALAALVRERQDLQTKWQIADEQLSAALSLSPERRGAADERARKQIAEIDARIPEIDRRLKGEFPNFFALARPEPLSIEDTAQLLHSDEALVLLLAGHAEETFVWALTREGASWQRIPLRAMALADKVKALREGLEIQDQKQAAQAGKLFDLGIAHEVYKALLAPVANLIDDKRHLLIVSSGVLTGLPFHLLVTEPPTTPRPNGLQLQAYRDAAWLIQRQAVTILPSVSSLRALRLLAKGAQAAKPMIGFGDPVFGQPSGPAQPGRATPQVVTRSTTKTRAYASYWRGTRTDLEALRAGLAPLPESAAELRAVARRLGAAESDLKLGPAASETTVKGTDLSVYRMVYFATHGLVGGEIASLAEPALALTIPNEPTELDDGLLTASEVAQLKLNADWVVLSACNTAAGDKPGAEALSGLARAFFYAGARALLVSHWQVDSGSAVRLTTSTFDALKKDPAIGRAEALRRAMLAMIEDQSNTWNAYPDYWGPFSIVGEGGAR
jgi:tetratricopeptide (TPR) repeat protein/CHAT domain-containing protein